MFSVSILFSKPKNSSYTHYGDAWSLDYVGVQIWSSEVCEGGESREAYACKLIFGPPQFLFEINDHVTQTHFWSTSKLIENALLIQFEVMKAISLKADQKWVWVTWSLILKRNLGGSKVSQHAYAISEYLLGWRNIDTFSKTSRN